MDTENGKLAEGERAVWEKMKQGKEKLGGGRRSNLIGIRDWARRGYHNGGSTSASAKNGS